MPAGIHTFDNTTDAYDYVQCGEHPDGTKIYRGDLLHIPSEHVIGMADTYPIALTSTKGELHSLSHGFSLETSPEQYTPILQTYVKDENTWGKSPDISLAMLRRRVLTAKRIASNRGWVIASYVDCK